MSRVPPPLLDPLTAESCVADAEARVPAFVPGWQPEPAGPGAALIQVYARFLKSLADRLNQAPDKNKMGFFDRLGIELLPAQPARAPVVFKPLQGMPDTSVPARTRVGAAPPDTGAPLVFETEQGIALAKASLAQVVSLWPGRDAWRDHTGGPRRRPAVPALRLARPRPSCVVPRARQRARALGRQHRRGSARAHCRRTRVPPHRLGVLGRRDLARVQGIHSRRRSPPIPIPPTSRPVSRAPASCAWRPIAAARLAQP
jgi:hypothetical protein